MRKTIVADGKEIVLQTNGLVPLLYKKEFKRDFFADVIALENRKLDAEIAYNFIWTFAKIANDNIPDLWDWAAEFEVFPVLDYIPVITEMVTACISTKKATDKRSSKKKTSS